MSVSTTTVIEHPKCPHCGQAPHDGQCPRIKSISYHPDGSIQHVEYHPAPKTETIETIRVRAYAPRRRRRRQTIGEWIFGC